MRSINFANARKGIITLIGGIFMNEKAALPFDIAVFDRYPETREINYQFAIVAVLKGQMISASILWRIRRRSLPLSPSSIISS